jgi:hypothetical protein
LTTLSLALAHSHQVQCNTSPTSLIVTIKIIQNVSSCRMTSTSGHR